MTLLVCRIDDRLIHGQVLVGWGRPLEIGRIALVDEAVAASPFEQDLYRLAVTDGTKVEFLAPPEAPARLAELAAGPERVLLLTGSVDVMAELARARPTAIHAINVGGVHEGPGRYEYLRYVYLTDGELATLAALVEEGVPVTAQDLPDVRPVALAAWKRAR